MRWRAEPWRPNLAVKLSSWLSVTFTVFALSFFGFGWFFPGTKVEGILAPAATGAIVTLCFGSRYGFLAAGTVATATAAFLLLVVPDFGLREDALDALAWCFALAVLTSGGVFITIGLRLLAAIAAGRIRAILRRELPARETPNAAP